QISKRVEMGPYQIANMDVVANAGAVGRRIIIAENFKARTDTERHLRRYFYQMRRSFARLAGSTSRVRTSDIEVPQNDIADVMRPSRIAQHDLAHQLRPTVRRNGRCRGRLVHRNVCSVPINCSRGRKDEMAYPRLDRAIN